VRPWLRRRGVASADSQPPRWKERTPQQRKRLPPSPIPSPKPRSGRLAGSRSVR
jgi:hypothetical protein